MSKSPRKRNRRLLFAAGVALSALSLAGSAFALFFLAEYANMILVSFLVPLFFCGGWLSPFPESWGLIGKGGPHWLMR